MSEANQVTLFFPPTYSRINYRKKVSPPPPLSIAYLAQQLKNNSIPVAAIDAHNFIYNEPLVKNESIRENYEAGLLKKFIRIVEKTKPRILGISSWTYAMPFTIEFIKAFKKRNPDVKVILGSHNATFLPNETLSVVPEADLLFRGKDSLSFLRLVQAILKNKSYEKLPDISFMNRKKGAVVNNASSSFRFSEKSFPVLDFSYFIDFKNPHTINLMSSVGCVFSCRFCSARSLWGGCFMFPVRLIKKQLEFIKKNTGASQVQFWDEQFALKKERALKIMGYLKEDNLQWMCSNRIDSVSRELLVKIKKAQCFNIFFGVESLNPKTLEFFYKTQHPQEYVANVKKKLKLLNELNLKSTLSFIIGCPLENKKEMYRTISEVEHLRNQYPNLRFEFSKLVAEINSPLWLDLKDKKESLFRLKNKYLIQQYSGYQPFSWKYSEKVELAPQHYMFKNHFIGNNELENIMLDIYKRVRGLEKFESNIFSEEKKSLIDEMRIANSMRNIFR